jgi:hypothetical protein
MADEDRQPEENLMDPSPLIAAGVVLIPLAVLGWFAFG